MQLEREKSISIDNNSTQEQELLWDNAFVKPMKGVGDENEEEEEEKEGKGGNVSVKNLEFALRLMSGDEAGTQLLDTVDEIGIVFEESDLSGVGDIIPVVTRYGRNLEIVDWLQVEYISLPVFVLTLSLCEGVCVVFWRGEGCVCISRSVLSPLL